MTELGRRDVLRAGGLTLSFGALVTACSSDDDPAIEVADDVETETAGPERVASDLALANTALSLEVLVFDMYQAGSDFALVQSDPLLESVPILQQHHADHRATLTVLVEAADGEPFTTANPVVKAGLVDPRLLSVATERDFIRLARDLEQTCAQLYVHIATSVSAPELRSTAMSIGAVASRRAAVLDLLGDLGNERPALIPSENPLPSDAVIPD